MNTNTTRNTNTDSNNKTNTNTSNNSNTHTNTNTTTSNSSSSGSVCSGVLLFYSRTKEETKCTGRGRAGDARSIDERSCEDSASRVCISLRLMRNESVLVEIS